MTIKAVAENDMSDLLFSNKVAKKEGKDSFDCIMNISINSLNSKKQDDKADSIGLKTTEYKIDNNQQTDNLKDKRIEDNNSNKNSSKSMKIEESKMVTKEDSAEFKENLEETVNELKEEIKEIFGISDEEIEKILGDMGISILNLLNPEVGKEFALIANGESNFVAVLSNEMLANSITQLSEVYERLNIEEKLGISTSELDSLIQEAMARLEAEDVVKVDIANVSEVSDAVEVNDGNIVLENKDTDNTNIKDNTIKSSSNNEIEIIIKDDGDNSSNLSDDNFLDNNDSAKAEASIEYYETFIENINKAVNINDLELINEVTKVKDMRNIVNQVIEKIKVSVNASTTTMDLQLNPENLGKVNLNIVSSNGEISAKFTVENEFVKEALEAQMEGLKERFSEQGIKVNSVEITVADNNLSKDNKDNLHQENHSDNKKKREFVKLDAVEEADIKDNIILEMMKENGNQVDYSA